MTKNVTPKTWNPFSWTDLTKRSYPQVNITATPTFSPAAGTYATSQSVAISCSTPSSTIYYTTDGSTPTPASAVYSSAITVSATETVQAIATAPGYTQSAVGSATYTIGTGSGYLAAGHWITKQALRVVYPRPDTETNTWASHHYAYWDGTTGVQYRRPIGVSFGGYPYVYQLISGPTGMTLVTPTVIGSSPPYPCAYVQWTPTAIVTNQTVTVRVFGQDYQNDGTSYVDVTWTVSTSSSTVHFIFVDSLNGNDTNAGTISAPLKTLAGAFGTTTAQSTFPGATCYIRQGSTVGALALMGAITGGSGYTNGTYTGVPLTGGTGTGAQAMIVVAGGVVTSVTCSNVPGSGYTVGDTLSAAASSIGGTGSGFSAPISTVASYAFPAYTDTSPAVFRLYNNLKPAAVIAYPGESPTIDSTTTNIHSLGSNPDLFLQDLTFNGFNIQIVNYKLYATLGALDDRMTFDGLTWNNSGFGAFASITGSISGPTLTVSTMAAGGYIAVGSRIYAAGVSGSPTVTALGTGTGGVGTYTISNSESVSLEAMTLTGGVDIPAMISVSQISYPSQAPNQYWLVNSSTQTNHQSGTPGNNYVICVFYTTSDVLVQGCSASTPTGVIDAGFYFKSDVTNGSMRGNLANFSNCGVCFGVGQAPYSLLNTTESCYNAAIGPCNIAAPFAGTTYTYGTIWVYRNSVAGNHGLESYIGGSTVGLFAWDANAVQTSYAVPPTGLLQQTTIANVSAATGLLDPTTGLLTGSYNNSTYVGRVGAQIV